MIRGPHGYAPSRLETAGPGERAGRLSKAQEHAGRAARSDPRRAQRVPPHGPIRSAAKRNPRHPCARAWRALPLLLLLAMSACSPSRPEAPRAYEYAVPLSQTFDLAAGRVLTEADEAQRFAGPAAPRLVFLGEHHGDPRSQAFQARFLRALVAQGHPVTVALEMFPPQADPALEAWRQGRLTDAEFVEQSRWYETWGFPWSAYRPLFQTIRDDHLPAYGVNVDEAARKAVRESPTGALPPELKAELGDLDLTVAPHRDAFLDALKEAGDDAGHPSRLAPEDPSFQRMQRVQVLWDTAMGVRAARLAEAAPPRGVVVAILGSGHVAYGLGANLRAARVSALPRLTVWDDVAATEDVDAQGRVRVPLGMADWVRVYPQDDTLQGTPSLAGLKLAAHPSGVRIEAVRVPPGDARAVFHAEDIVQAVQGEPVTSPARLRLRVEGLAWNQPAEVKVLRGGVSTRLTFTPRPSHVDP